MDLNRRISGTRFKREGVVKQEKGNLYEPLPLSSFDPQLITEIMLQFGDITSGDDISSLIERYTAILGKISILSLVNRSSMNEDFTSLYNLDSLMLSISVTKWL